MSMVGVLVPAHISTSTCIYLLAQAGEARNLLAVWKFGSEELHEGLGPACRRGCSFTAKVPIKRV